MKKFMSLMVAVGLVALSASPLYAATVNCNSPRQDLQKEIDSAEGGERIFIRGTCEGPFSIINKDLTLIGPATLSAPDDRFTPVLQIVRASVELRDLNFDASANSIGILIQGSTADIRNIVVEGARFVGIFVTTTSFADIAASEARNNESGLLVTHSSSVRLTSNTVEDNESFGVIVKSSSSASVGSGNVIEDNRVGFQIEGNAAARIDGATITNNEKDGAGGGLSVGNDGFVELGPNNTIEDNLIDVVCFNRGGIKSIEGVQMSTTKTLFDDGTCLISGTLFSP